LFIAPSYNEFKMKKRVIVFFIITILPMTSYASILKITVDAAIHPITSEYIRNTIDRAERENARLIIMAINTPGGLDTSMREIIEKILASKTPVAIFVSPSGARAASAGFFIGIACDIFVMAPGTSTGAAHPVGVSITGQPMDETMAEKVTHDAASYIKTLAEKRGRNTKLAEDAVRESLSYTEREALEGKLIDLIAKNDQEIINYFDGKTIKRFNGEEVQLELKDEDIIDIPMSARQKFLITISNPNLAYILLMLGLLGLYFEFSNPGAILPGVLGGICLLMAIFSFQILPINYVGLILILLAGSIMLIDTPIPELRPSLNFIIPVAVGISAIFIFLIVIAIKAHMRRVHTGKEGLVGEIGVVQIDLKPEGKVFVHGELWDAEATEEIPKGTKVKIVVKIKVTKV